MQSGYALDRVENLVHRAAERLWTAFDEYWPAIHSNAIGEANILAAIAQELGALGNLKVHLFMESPFKCDGNETTEEWARPNGENKKHSRVDAVAFFDDDEAGKFVAAFEAKRLFDIDGARSVLADIDRLRNFKLEKSNNQMGDNKYTDWHKSAIVNVVVAMTRKEAFGKWWIGEKGYWPGDSRSKQEWECLRYKLDQLCGAICHSYEGRRGVIDSGQKYNRTGRYFDNDTTGEWNPKLLYLIYSQAQDFKG